LFESLGVSELAETVYVALLTHPELGVAALAGQLQLREWDVRKALDELMDLALLTEGTSELGVRVVGPTVGLAALFARVEEDVVRRLQQLDATRAAIARLAAAHDDSRPRERLLRLDGVDAVRSRIDELADWAKRECVSLNPSTAQTLDAKAASAPLNARMLGRGVAIRSVYQDSFRNDPRLVRYARMFTSLGGQLRTAPTVPLLMIIYDQSVALLPVDPNNSRLGAHEVRSEGMVAAAYALFEEIWSSARWVDEAPPDRDDDAPDPQTRALLQILAAGGTDEMVARKLTVSVRTAKRLASELMEQLGARSRFEAGVKASRRGWI
jgi:predicted transcriptional regulator/DNA-binding CsgD family transcriptional regulator